MFKIIVAYDNDLVIGYKGWMPWDLPEDLQHFKETTDNSNLVMGRTTFDGLKSPLANRTTYVVSRRPLIESDNVIWISDLDQFIKEHQNSDKEFFICGGASIYKQFLPYTNEMIISLVSGKHKSDTHFPDFNEDDFDRKLLKTYNDFKVYKYTRKEVAHADN